MIGCSRDNCSVSMEQYFQEGPNTCSQCKAIQIYFEMSTCYVFHCQPFVNSNWSQICYTWNNETKTIAISYHLFISNSGHEKVHQGFSLSVVTCREVFLVGVLAIRSPRAMFSLKYMHDQLGTVERIHVELIFWWSNAKTYQVALTWSWFNMTAGEGLQCGTSRLIDAE